MKTKQIDFWKGEFGEEYTKRNSYSQQEWDQFYMDTWGITKIDMNSEFLSDLPKDARILEVGCNVGLQLAGLQRMGYTNLYGIELQEGAVETAKQNLRGINVIQGSGFDIPFKDGYFDLVFTSGVLIHINPSDLDKIMSEMVRCSKKYIWGFEYFSKDVEDIEYRGNKGFLWKADYSRLFTEKFPGLQLLKQKLYKYVQSENVDAMYLLSK